MTRIATLFLLIFSLVQVAPAFQSLIAESQGYVFNIDEEKHAEKSFGDEKKQKKECPHAPAHLLTAGRHAAGNADKQEALHGAPCLEMPTPPPNA